MDFYTIINYSAVFVFGIILGFLSAIPVGAVQFLVVKTALQGQRRPAVLIALGSGTSDIVYGLIMLFGLGKFMLSSRFQVLFYILGVLVLSVMLCQSIMEYRRENAGPDCPNGFKNNKKKHSFLTGFTLAITNPAIALWWIVGFKIFLDLGLFTEVTVPLRIAFILSGAAGLAGYLIILALVIYRIHHTISDSVFRRMNFALMIVLVLLIAYFIFKAIRRTVC